MILQFITDNKGEPTGVYIPIDEWNSLLKRHKELREEAARPEIPEWHQQVVAERMEHYQKNPGTSVDFNAAISELDNGL